MVVRQMRGGLWRGYVSDSHDTGYRDVSPSLSCVRGQQDMLCPCSNAVVQEHCECMHDIQSDEMIRIVLCVQKWPSTCITPCFRLIA